MSNYLLWKRSIIAGGGIIGSGVLLYKFTTPTEEQMIAALSPELRANYLKNRELRQKEQEELIKIVQKTSASNDPIWHTGTIASPFGNGGTKKSLLVVKEEFDKDQAAMNQKLELEESKKLLKELEQKKTEEEKKKAKKYWIF